MLVFSHEDLRRNSKEEESVEGDKRNRKSLDYKINIDILDFYDGMHVKEILEWISMVDSFVEYIKIPQRSGLSFVAFKLKSATSAWWQHIQNRRRVQGKQFIKSWPRIQSMMKEYFRRLIMNSSYILKY